MISRLRGIVEECGDGFVVLDVGGVGYHLSCSARTLAALPGLGKAASVFTEMQVSDDNIRLTAFGSSDERVWFRLLCGVQGVGARVALSVLSTMSVNELSRAVAQGDKDMVARAQGVGPKMAQRIVSELKDKGHIFGVGDADVDFTADNARFVDGVAADAVSALVNLGYGQARAAAAVSAVQRAEEGAVDIETLIRLSLKDLAR